MLKVKGEIMSQLLQAKREAKRLLKLSQENNSAINISTLSEARKYIALLKGYHSWHDYEENLKRQDFLTGSIPNKTSPLLEMENDVTDYFLKQSQFMVHIPEENNNIFNIVQAQSHMPTVLGQSIPKTTKKWLSNKPSIETFLLNVFPTTIVGSTGAGKTQFILSQASQFIANGEGVIYIDSKGEVSLYDKIYSMAKEVNRENDVLVLNMYTLNNYQMDGVHKTTHSIDPINPMIGDKNLFKNLYGDEIGIVIHDIALYCKANKMLLDGSNIESILMINNLIQWTDNSVFGKDATQSIIDYLKNIGLEDNLNSLTEDEFDNMLLKHVNYCKKARVVVETIKECESKDIFSKTPTIDLLDVYLNKKILFIVMPALEKKWEYMTVLSNTVFALIWKTAADIEKEMNYKSYFLQNVIVDEVNYSISNKLGEIVYKKLPKNTNYIFSSQDFDMYNHISINQAVAVSKTIIMMKTAYLNTIPNNLKGRIVENTRNNIHVLYGNDFNLRELREGQAYVYTEINRDSELEANNGKNEIYNYKFTSLSGENYQGDKTKYLKLQYGDFANNKEYSDFRYIQLIYIEHRKTQYVTLNQRVPSLKIRESITLSQLYEKKDN